MRKKKHEDTGKKLVGDPRIGKRVFCVSLLPAIHVFGTIQSIVRYPNGMEYWKVLTEHEMIGDGPATDFVLYEQAPELHAGDRVGYRLDEGGGREILLGTVQRPVWAITHLRFVVAFDRGDAFAVVPQRLTKI